MQKILTVSSSVCLPLCRRRFFFFNSSWEYTRNEYYEYFHRTFLINLNFLASLNYNLEERTLVQYLRTISLELFFE